MPIDSNHNMALNKLEKSPPNRRWWFCLLIVSLLWPLSPIAAQEAPADPETNVEAKNAPVVQPAAVDPAEAAALVTKKRRALVLGTMLLAGVVAVLLLMFLWMLWWSRRTRKLLREPLPAAGRGDELWYLKAKHDVQKATERLTAERETPPPPSRSRPEP